ncbi:immunoglobulin kappa light chain-like isoform X2 [Chiloscyllium plagiosum]|uniref:immunoglobulin kappa light chain-like isoform X2 n=1 Tax=Chiloscyllium plagiosum TaxID=36176 RepID=UPI001CB86199|nr:immunoglobulin kappa light chain-like isoform X2 [Chiloscyllium plagiosum]
MCEMKIFYTFLQLLLPFTDGQRDLQQLAHLSVEKGGLISLDCFHSVPNLQRFEARWVFRNNNQAPPKIIANLSTSVSQVTHYRYFAMHNFHKKAFTLRITDVQVSDTGRYHCEMFQTAPPPSGKRIGKGTMLSVTAPPSLWLFISSKETVSSSSAIINCSAHDFYPKTIIMMFQTTCLINQLTNESQISNPDGMYNYIAIVNISTENCNNSNKFTCIIQHPASQFKTNHTILIHVHPRDEDHNGHLWMLPFILLSICGGIACTILLVLFLIKYIHGRKGTQGRKGNHEESSGNNICYAELQLENLQQTLKQKEEETVYSSVLHSNSGE